MRTTCLTFAVLALAASVSSQTLVTNGDFSNGINGWTQKGYSLGATVDNFNVTGFSSNACFNCRPGGQTTPPPYAPNSIEQEVLLLKGVTYEFQADVAIARLTNTGNADAGTFEVIVDGVSVAKRAFGNFTAGATYRDKLSSRFVAQNTGKRLLQITFHRTYLSSTSSPTPTTYIDNIFLAIAPGPTLGVFGERTAGKTINAEVRGAASDPVAVYFSPVALAKPISIPGWNGQLQLGNPIFFFNNGKLDTTGLFKFTLKVPNNLAGARVLVQPVEANAAGVISLGHGVWVNIY